MKMFLQCIAIFVGIAGYYCATESPVVETPLGKVGGYLGTSYNGRTYLAFEGIPYGKPPVGGRRFEEPEPIDPWEDILNATVPTSCVQGTAALSISVGSEDCLHVNVYVPREKINPDEKLEVVVNIHGGGYSTGSGAKNGPTYVADKDVVYVTINYRLTVFGFLSTEDDVVPGNNGLKDQVLALKWVQNNIESFGGNPDSVTIIGGSAGAGSVHLHYLSEQSKGLFHRGLAQSGSALNTWATIEGNLDRAKKLADSLDCPTDTTRKLVDCLKQISHEKIAEKVQMFHEYNWAIIIPFGPVVEKAGSNPFIAEHPYTLLANGQVQDLPLIISNTIHEGQLVVGTFNDELYTFVDKNWDELAPIVFDYNYTLPEDSWLNAAAAIREHYFGDEEITSDNKLKLIQAFTDRFFEYDDETAVRLQAKVTTSPVYYYMFAYPGDNNPDQTVTHGAEGQYMSGFPGLALSENDLKMKDLLWDMVVSYAKTDIPTFGDTEWQPTRYEEDVYLYISGVKTEDIEMKTAEELTDRKFWKSLNFAENENLASE